MSARAVVARGFPFSPREGSFADVGVALDEIRGLPAPPEPLLLRVDAVGGTAEERLAVTGDWLIDAELVEPRRLPPRERKDRKEPWIYFWENGTDPGDLLYTAAKRGVDIRLIVRAAVTCVRRAVPMLPEPAIPTALDTLSHVEGWARRRNARATIERDLSNLEEARNLYLEEDARAYESIAAFNACISLCHAAITAEEIPTDSSPRIHATNAVQSMRSAYGAEFTPEQDEELATIIRAQIPTLTFLRALVRT